VTMAGHASRTSSGVKVPPLMPAADGPTNAPEERCQRSFPTQPAPASKIPPFSLQVSWHNQPTIGAMYDGFSDCRRMKVQSVYSCVLLIEEAGKHGHTCVIFTNHVKSHLNKLWWQYCLSHARSCHRNDYVCMNVTFATLQRQCITKTYERQLECRVVSLTDVTVKTR
jgi:hypothetical protein